MKILNLYACLGGNRYKWDEVAKEAGVNIEVTAVELDPELAKLYQERFPNDKVIVEDAHEYLLHNYKDFDFIWTSPPCPTHSRARFWAIGSNGKKPIYPDMRLYEEIIFLQYHFNKKYVIENVIPYYEPFLNPKKRGRHLYWTNFNLPNNINERKLQICAGKEELKRLCKFHDYDFTKYKGKQLVLKIARNLVDYEAGKTIFQTVLGIYKQQNANQTSLF
jgi:DNA (cytosine-5)-methyltransferase 1